MRISDWSSDVCSSDLKQKIRIREFFQWNVSVGNYKILNSSFPGFKNKVLPIPGSSYRKKQGFGRKIDPAAICLQVEDLRIISLNKGTGSNNVRYGLNRVQIRKFYQISEIVPASPKK